MSLVKKHPFLGAWLIALFGCVLSLYYREIREIEPCPLCWYQRIALYPIAVILGMALYRGDEKVISYLFPFAFFGFFIAFYQVLGIYFPIILNNGLCGAQSHCTSGIFLLFGFLTFPMLSSLGFAAIIVLFFLGKRKKD